MTVDLISNIIRYKDYYLVISGIYSDKSITVLDKDLKTISSHPFDKLSVWFSDLHVEEEQSTILISITTTEIFLTQDKKYQGFNTFWFRLSEKTGNFSLEKIAAWTQSDITRIKSKKVGTTRHWMCLKQITLINELGNKEVKYQLGLAAGKNLSIPSFEYPFGDQSYIKTEFDFEIENDLILVAAICSSSWNKPSIIKLDPARKETQNISLEIPLAKLHHFQGSKLIKIKDSLFAYFWTTTHENAKKYKFELTKVSVDTNELSNSKIERVNNEGFIHNVVWSDNRLLIYKKAFNDPKSYVLELDDNGNESEKKVIENWTPIFIDQSNIVAIGGKELRKFEV